MERKLIVLRGNGENGLIKAEKTNDGVTLELRAPIRGDIEFAIVTENDERRFVVRDFSGVAKISCGDVNTERAAFFVLRNGEAVFKGCRCAECKGYVPRQYVPQERETAAKLSGCAQTLSGKIEKGDAAISAEEKENAKTKNENACVASAQSSARERYISDIFPSLGGYADNAVADENYFDIVEEAISVDLQEILENEERLLGGYDFESAREAASVTEAESLTKVESVTEAESAVEVKPMTEAESRASVAGELCAEALDKITDSSTSEKTTKLHNEPGYSGGDFTKSVANKEADCLSESESNGATVITEEGKIVSVVSVTGELDERGLKAESGGRLLRSESVKRESFGYKARERRAMRKKALRAKADEFCTNDVFVASVADCDTYDAGGRKLTFYERVSDDIERLLKNGKKEEVLQERFPFSRWVSVAYDERRRYVVGVIGQRPHYICYGLPAPSYDYPPSALSGCARWLPLDVRFPRGAGYWLIYQDCETGGCVKDAFAADTE